MLGFVRVLCGVLQKILLLERPSFGQLLLSSKDLVCQDVEVDPGSLSCSFSNKLFPSALRHSRICTGRTYARSANHPSAGDLHQMFFHCHKDNRLE